GSRGHLQAHPGRSQAAVQPAGGDPPPQTHRVAGVRQRRVVVGGLRPRRGLHHALGGRRLGVRLLLAGRPRGRARDAHRRRVVPPERARLPLRRRRLRGRHRQPRTDRRGHRRQCAARRLRPHRRGVDLLGGAERRVGAAVRLRTRGDVRLPARGAARRAEPARRAGVRRVLRGPHLRLHDRDPRHGGVGGDPADQRRPGPCRERRPGPEAGEGLRPGDHDDRAGLPAGAGLLLRVRRAHRRRGDLQRRAGVPQAQEPQRRHDAAAARRHRDHDADEHHRAGPRDGAEVRRPPPSRAAQGVRRDEAARGLRPAHGGGTAGPGRVLRLRPRFLLRHLDDRRHPRAGGQHRLQRLPRARVDPRQGRLPAAPARGPRRPAGLQQRHPDPRAPGGGADRRLRRGGHPAHPALHRRGVRLLHPQPARDDPALDAAPAHGDRPGHAAADDAVAGDQHLRARDDRRRARGRAGHQVPRGCVDRDPRDGRLLPHDARHPHPLRPGRQGAGHRGGGPAAADAGPRDRAGVEGAQADDAGARLRQGQSPEPPRGGARQHRPRRARPDRRRVGPAQHRRTAEDPRLALPRGDPAGRAVHPRDPRGAAARRRRGLHPGVRRGSLVGAAAPQPDGVPAQGPAAVQPRDHGDLRALPALLLPPRREACGAVRGGPRRPRVRRLGRRRGRRRGPAGPRV
ncbi:MAG: Uncharacterized amino acid permease, GabP family, partial [uncultured Nocardioidaceae bacterium]